MCMVRVEGYIFTLGHCSSNFEDVIVSLVDLMSVFQRSMGLVAGFDR